jgi:hypothetical protein
VKPVIFVSHWGEDSTEANWLADELCRALAAFDVNVFSTSAPANRFEAFDPDLGSGFEVAFRAYADELRTYLYDQLEAAVGYLLLLTQRSLERNSVWVRWEIRHGTQFARERGIPFIPCLLGVGYDALVRDAAGALSEWQQLEVGGGNAGTHPEAEFQAVLMDSPDGLVRVTSALEQSVQQSKPSRRRS